VRIRGSETINITIGMAVFNDYSGVFFTIEAIRFYHPEIQPEIIVIDNSPNTRQGKRTREFIRSIGAKYVPYTDKIGTSVREQVYRHATTPYVLIVDSHVLIAPEAIAKLVDYYGSNPTTPNLLHGVLVSDDMTAYSTHLEPGWGSKRMYGEWGADQRGADPDGLPFEIHAAGMGLWSCRRDAWLGLNPAFRGFGGEEGYIHHKWRQAGRKVLCLPFLRYLHRFGRSGPVPKTKDTYRNYLIGWKELGLDTKEIEEYFNSPTS